MPGYQPHIIIKPVIWLWLCLSLLASTSTLALDVGFSDYWTSVNPQPGNGTYYSVSWDGATYRAVGKYGAMITSADGSTWTAINSHTAIDLNDIVRINSKYYVIGWGGALLVSTDGSNWTVSSTGKPVADGSNSSIKYRALAGNVGFGSTTIIAVGDNGEMARSTDNGVSWSTDTIRLRFNNTLGVALQDIIWQGTQGRFYAVGSQGAIMYSPDGITWLRSNYNSGGVVPVTSEKLNSIKWDGAQFIVIGDNDTLLTSNTDGTWVSQTVNTTKCNDSATPLIEKKCQLNDIAIGTSAQVIVGTQGLILVSVDNGTTWSEAITTADTTLHSVVWDSTNSQFVVVGSNAILTSPDGMTWTAVSPTTPALTGLAFNGSQFVATSTAAALTSTNGFAWGAATAASTSGISDISWDGTRYVALHNGNAIITSVNGINWAAATPIPGASGLTDVSVDGPAYIAVGTGGQIYHSGDSGSSWTTRASGIGTNLYTVAWNSTSSQYQTMGPNGLALTSPDGSSWTLISAYHALNNPNGIRILHFSWSTNGAVSREFIPGAWPTTTRYDLIWNGREYALVGDSGTVLYSTDGRTWYYPPAIGGAGNLTGVTWSGTHFIVGDDTGNIYINAGPDMGISAYINPTTLDWDNNTRVGSVAYPLEYHFQINNNGDLSATAVTATIDLLMQTAPTVEFVDSDSLSMCTQTIYQISCVLGQINSGGTDDTELVIKITPSDIGSLQVNTLITLDQDDAIPSNNQTTLVYGIQSAGNKLTNDFNRSSGGSGRLGPWLMMLFITALLATVRRRDTC